MEITENEAKRRRMACIKGVREFPDLGIPAGAFRVPDYILERGKWMVPKDADALGVMARGCCTIDELTFLVLGGKLDELGDREEIKRFSRGALESRIEKMQQLVVDDGQESMEARKLMKSSKFIECLAMQRLEQLAQQMAEDSDEDTEPTRHEQVRDQEVELPAWAKEVSELTGYTPETPSMCDMACQTDISDNLTPDDENTQEPIASLVTVSLGLLLTTPRTGSSSSTPPLTTRRAYKPYASLMIHDASCTIPMMLPTLYIGRGASSPSALDISKYSNHMKRISKKQLLLVAEPGGIRVLPLGRNSVDVSIGEQETQSLSVDTAPLLISQRAVLTVVDVTIVLIPAM